MAVHLYTPAQVTIPARTEEHIRVIGGKVWDFSRFALVTPVVVARGAGTAGSNALPANKQRCQCFEVAFEPGVAVLSQAMKWRLEELPRSREILVAAGPSALAHMRAQAVSAFLLSRGFKPVPRSLYRKGAENEVLVLTSTR